MPGWTMSEPSSTTPAPATATSESFDPQRRRLCADGSCVGVVGADGRCRVCGLAHPEGGAAAAVHAPVEDEASDDLEADDGSALPAADAEPGSGFNPARGLCPDGSCVGVLGPDKRCKVCGRGPESAAGAGV
jgi:hypothetical protein